jgi:hypothetical protein
MAATRPWTPCSRACRRRRCCGLHMMKLRAGFTSSNAITRTSTGRGSGWMRWLDPFAMVTITKDPKVAAVHLAAWNRLADALAAALGVAG